MHAVLVVVGSLLCCLNVMGQFHLSKMAAQLSQSQGRLEICLDCDVTAWDSPRITEHAGKIGKISYWVQRAPGLAALSAFVLVGWVCVS